MSKVFIPENYHSQLNLIETEVAIKMIKDYFERRLSEELRLTRVSAPLFLLKNTGLNDDLNGTERPVASVPDRGRRYSCCREPICNHLPSCQTSLSGR